MNNHRNNNNNNNRRRGRPSNNRSQGGANQANRIDSRARGNAPQLLDKYKKLAQDAYHNGDRVQQEYYLQFADHYFRVLADNKARQDEARAKRPDERGDSGDDQNDSDDDDNGHDRGNNRRPRGRRDEREDGGGNNDRGAERSPVKGRGRRPRDDDSHNDDDDRPGGAEGAQDDKRNVPVKRKLPAPRKPRVARASAEDSAIDAAVLPPAFGDDGAAAEKPKRAPRRRKISDNEAAEAAE